MSSAINDISHCQICFNRYGSDNFCPRVLSCGHTFCHSCLQRFISEGSVCPTCKNDILFRSANDILINFAVKSLSETLTKTNDSPKVINDTLEAAALTNNLESLVVQEVTKNKGLPYEGHCEEHCIPNHFKCMNCNEYICGTCVVFMHKSCPKVLPVLEALNSMKKEKLKKIKVFKTKLEKESKVLDLQLNHLNRKQEKLYQEIESVAAEIKETKSKKERNQKLHEHSSCHEENIGRATCNEDYQKVGSKVKFFFEENSVDILLSPSYILPKKDAIKLTMKVLKEKTFYMMKGDNEEMKYAKVNVEDDQISFGEWVEGVDGKFDAVDFLYFISSRTAVIDTHKFIEEHKKELYNPKLPKDKFKFSKIEVKETGVYFDCFETSKRSDFIFVFGSLLKTIGCSSVVPGEAFLKIQCLSVGEVIITADGGSPRDLNFLLLASGIMDDSYIGTSFGIFESIACGGWKNEDNEGSYIPGVVEGIENGGIYKNVIERGDVAGGDANEPNRLSLFCFAMEDSDSEYLGTTFGRVKRGMEVVDQIEGETSVNKCGLLYDFP